MSNGKSAIDGQRYPIAQTDRRARSGLSVRLDIIVSNDLAPERDFIAHVLLRRIQRLLLFGIGLHIGLFVAFEHFRVRRAPSVVQR